MFTIGVDLGKAQDPTALAVVEKKPPELHLRHLERLPLGTPYPKVIEHVAALMGRAPLQGDVELVVDATGVGAPVVDQMRERGLSPIPVTITSGKAVKLVKGAWRVPKFVLVRALETAIEDGRLKLPRNLPAVEVLLKELERSRSSLSVARRALSVSAGIRIATSSGAASGGRGASLRLPPNALLALPCEFWLPDRRPPNNRSVVRRPASR